jgi:hypothetical protein
MHHFPVVGKPRDVAGAIVDMSMSLLSPSPAASEDSESCTRSQQPLVIRTSWSEHRGAEFQYLGLDVEP